MRKKMLSQVIGITSHKIGEPLVGGRSYGSFRNYPIGVSGRSAVFMYSNGIEYNVNARFLLSWYHATSHVYARGRWRWLAEPIPLPETVDDKICVVRTQGVSGVYNRRIQWVRVFFSTGISVDVDHDHVLAHCEPAFVHYGWAGHTLQDEEKKGRDRLPLCMVDCCLQFVNKKNGWQCKSIVFDDANDLCTVNMYTGDSYVFKQQLVGKVFPVVVNMPTEKCRVGKGPIRGRRVRLEQPPVERVANNIHTIVRFLRQVDYRFAGVTEDELAGRSGDASLNGNQGTLP